MKTTLLIFLFFLLWHNTYSQRINRRMIVNGLEEYYLCYIKSEPIIDTITIKRTQGLRGVDFIETETLISAIKLRVKILDIYYTKKSYELALKVREALIDSLPDHLEPALSDKTLDVFVEFNKKNVLRKLKKIYSKKQLLVTSLVLNNNSWLIHKYFFLKNFDYFDQLIKIE